MKGIKKKIRDSLYLKWLLIISSWIFQGIPNLDRSEKIYKIMFCLLLISIFYLWFNYNILYSMIIGHTINWIINGNIFLILIHRLKLLKTNKNSIFKYSQNLSGRLSKQNWVLYSAAFGSISRGKLNDYSDLDVSIVRKKGFLSCIKGLWFLFIEKQISQIKKIPLEIYLNDTPESSVKRFLKESKPVIIYDDDNILKGYYDNFLTISQAKKINNIL